MQQGGNVKNQEEQGAASLRRQVKALHRQFGRLADETMLSMLNTAQLKKFVAHLEKEKLENEKPKACATPTTTVTSDDDGTPFTLEVRKGGKEKPGTASGTSAPNARKQQQQQQLGGKPCPLATHVKTNPKKQHQRHHPQAQKGQPIKKATLTQPTIGSVFPPLPDKKHQPSPPPASPPTTSKSRYSTAATKALAAHGPPVEGGRCMYG